MLSDFRDRSIVFLTTLFARRGEMFNTLPSASDEPQVVEPGLDPDRILLFGSGIVVGTSVSSHRLGLAGHLGSHITAATGRGVTVDIIPRPGLTVAAVRSALSAIDLSRYDQVVMAVGLNDALLFRRPRAWRRSLTEISDYLRDHLAQGSHAFLITIADPSVSPMFRRIPGRAAARHAKKLNRQSVKVARDAEHLSLITYHLQARDFGPDGYDTHAYGRWATELSPEIIRVLVEGHPELPADPAGRIPEARQ